MSKARAAHAFLDTIREGHPDTPVLVISAVACPIHERNPGPVTKDPEGKARAASRSLDPDIGALTLTRTREILAEIVADRADERLLFLDGRELFGEEDVAMLYDGLHPDQRGLDLIAGRFAKWVMESGAQRGLPSPPDHIRWMTAGTDAAVDSAPSPSRRSWPTVTMPMPGWPSSARNSAGPRGCNRP